MDTEETLELTVAACKDHPRLLRFAMEFVLDYEKHCCALLQKIINEDDSIHVIIEKDTENCVSPTVYGVFTYNPSGRLVFSCLPCQNNQVRLALHTYFSSRSVFCISGFKPYADFFESIVKEIVPSRKKEIHDYYFMHFNPQVSYLGNWYKESGTIVKNCRLYDLKDKKQHMAAVEWLCSQETRLARELGIVQCGPRDADALIQLQINYSTEEVLPAWRNPVPAAERHTLEQTLLYQFVFGIRAGSSTFAAKANSNAITPNYLQVGGVYTMPQHRSHGHACALVRHVAITALKEKKQAVLFVKEHNLPAIKAYTKAGFEMIGKYKIVYYME